jgi:hypothetical protein
VLKQTAFNQICAYIPLKINFYKFKKRMEANFTNQRPKMNLKDCFQAFVLTQDLNPKPKNTISNSGTPYNRIKSFSKYNLNE